MVPIVPLSTDDPFEPPKRISGYISHHLCPGVNGFGMALEVIFYYLCPGANGFGSALEVISYPLCLGTNGFDSSPEIFETACALIRNDSNHQCDNSNDQRENFHRTLPLFTKF
ncbi:MAG: hypothetical protein ACE5I0_07070 [Candidatus Binatia bacterium]